MIDDIAFSASSKAQKLNPKKALNRLHTEDNGDTLFDTTDFVIFMNHLPELTRREHIQKHVGNVFTDHWKAALQLFSQFSQLFTPTEMRSSLKRDSILWESSRGAQKSSIMTLRSRCEYTLTYLF